jgi:hypothetical protein
MAQLSRPYQIALGALVVLALAWFVVLHRPGSSSSTPEPARPAASTKAPAAAGTNTPGTAAAGANAAGANTAASSAKAPPSPGASTPVYNGPVPGLHGLTRDIARAHGAVATSETNAKELAEKSAQASNAQVSTGVAPPSGTPSASGTPGATSTAGATSTPSATAASSSAAASGSASATSSSVHSIVSGLSTGAAAATAQQAKQRAVLQSQLSHGKVVLLLFWNPKASDDVATFVEALRVSVHDKNVVLHVALASQVSLYGSVTRNVGIFQTPTLLVIGKNGLTVTLTGLSDRFTIEQAISEAQAASKSA